MHPAAKACKDSVAKLCKDVSDEKSPGSVLACLRSVLPRVGRFHHLFFDVEDFCREKKSKTSAMCKKEIFRTQEEVRSATFHECKTSVEQLIISGAGS
jgi:Golgi apparatus protein 1